jgi:hypothetical protein
MWPNLAILIHAVLVRLRGDSRTWHNRVAKPIMPTPYTALACLAAASLCGCTEPAEPAPASTPELAVAADLDPDPDVVEIELYAEPGVVEFRPGTPTGCSAIETGARRERWPAYRGRGFARKSAIA